MNCVYAWLWIAAWKLARSAEKRNDEQEEKRKQAGCGKKRPISAQGALI